NPYRHHQRGQYLSSQICVQCSQTQPISSASETRSATQIPARFEARGGVKRREEFPNNFSAVFVLSRCETTARQIPARLTANQCSTQRELRSYPPRRRLDSPACVLFRAPSAGNHPGRPLKLGGDFPRLFRVETAHGRAPGICG